jgi:Tol biopolymer transport system component
MKQRVAGVPIFGSAAAIALGAAMPAQAHGTTERVSVGLGGAQSNGFSESPAISADGRFVAFSSRATNLVPDDTNARADVFVHDRRTGSTRRVSLGPGHVQADGESLAPALSADGRFVAFGSFATNLVPGDGNGDEDVFVHDRLTGVTELASLGAGGVRPNSGSEGAAISGDGRFVAFHSFATNLVPGDTNGFSDVFVRDRLAGTTHRVSVGRGGAQGDGHSGGAALSADGRLVGFLSEATNFVPGDTSRAINAYIRNRPMHVTSQADVGPDRAPPDGGTCCGVALSADGRFIAFSSYATNLVPGDTNAEMDLFVHNRKTGETRRASVGPGGAQSDSFSGFPALSADGRFVAFESLATNLVPGDTNGVFDVFVHDRRTGAVRRVSVSTSGAQGNASSQTNAPAISAEGRIIAFSSGASNLVPGDTNGEFDIFVRTLVP